MFGFIAYIAILTSCACGLTFHFKWMIIACAAVLFTISTVQNRHLYRRCYNGPQESQGFALVTMAMSFLNGLAACGASYILGAVIGTAFHP